MAFKQEKREKKSYCNVDTRRMCSTTVGLSRWKPHFIVKNIRPDRSILQRLNDNRYVTFLLIIVVVIIIANSLHQLSIDSQMVLHRGALNGWKRIQRYNSNQTVFHDVTCLQVISIQKKSHKFSIHVRRHSIKIRLGNACIAYV